MTFLGSLAYNYHNIYVFVRGSECVRQMLGSSVSYKCKQTDNGEVIFNFEPIGLVLLYNINSSTKISSHLDLVSYFLFFLINRNGSWHT